MGLTGGIGAGKSAVLGRLAELGAVVVDADRLAREVVDVGTPGHAAVVAAFGDQVVGPGGALDRAALAARVFGDDEARRTLEGIVHPRVRARTEEITRAAPAGAVVVNDVPLLVEVGLAPTYHLVVVVEVARDVRLDRLVRRGLDRADAAARMAAQADDATRRAVADAVLDNSGTPAALAEQVDRLWYGRLVPFAANLRAGVPVDLPPDPPTVTSDPSWPARYARHAARIRHAIGGLAVEHVGPTAVPGMAARDVIEIQVAVPAGGDAATLADPLAAAGYPPRAAGGPYGSADPAERVVVYVRPASSDSWRAPLLVRDWLRAQPIGAARYPGDARAPTVPAAAREWAAASGWVPR